MDERIGHAGSTNPLAGGGMLSALESVIAERKALAPGSHSYVRRLLDGGYVAIAAKIEEEAREVIEAAAEPGQPGADHLVREVADLVFHLLVMLAAREVAWSAVEAELARRFGIGGLDEKAARRIAESG